MGEAGEKPCILIVDDTPSNLALLSDVLKDDYRVLIAVDGEKALAIARSAAPPDLILLDVMMPKLDGYGVCSRLKADPGTAAIPVIFVTSLGEVEDEMRGLALGGVDYVTKPISAAIVQARVATHLALSQHARQMQRLIATLETQARELAALNRDLESRVAQQVAEVERLGRLKRFFSPPVVELMLSGEADDPLKSHRREVVAVFLDLRGYTAFTETADPEDVMRALGEFHEAMGRLVMKYAGTLEHFAGDGMMIFFNDPVEIDDPAVVAVAMAVDMQRCFASLAKGWQRRGYDLAMGIGIAQGFATIGAIGFEGRRDYGVIGTVTNLAARLCADAKPGQILVSQRVQGAIAETRRADAIGALTLRGFQRPVPAFAVDWVSDVHTASLT